MLLFPKVLLQTLNWGKYDFFNLKKLIIEEVLAIDLQILFDKYQADLTVYIPLYFNFLFHWNLYLQQFYFIILIDLEKLWIAEVC